MENIEIEPDGLTRTNVTVKGKGFELTFRATVPTGPTTARELLPLARGLSEVMVREGIKAAAEQGRKISCCSGCGACCRNIVAISQLEARLLADLVEGLDQPRRSVIESRFAEARRQLEASGLAEKLASFESWEPADYQAMVGAYFALGIPCPFLENESCSIYPERPLTCREFLVTSPPQHCSEQDSGAVRQVVLPLHVFNAVARWNVPKQGPILERWVPLILALDWARANPDTTPPKPGLELLQDFLGCMEEPH